MASFGRSAFAGDLLYSARIRPRWDPDVELEFGLADLGRVRQLIRRAALEAGLPPAKADGLVVAVNEVAANALVHGRPPAVLQVWGRPREVICEISDAGPGIDDVHAGQLRPEPDRAGGRGLWLARQLCDAFEIRNEGESAVLLHVAAIGGGPSAN
jgi:anti-sigma regulatory factor (Ser/Thr protein kinase)